jgi:regulator of protease activity HflC (stomatin/prohibitin superfamily)
MAAVDVNNPQEWQAAYTREQAFKDSWKYSRVSIAAILISIIAIGLYLGTQIFQYIKFVSDYNFLQIILFWAVTGILLAITAALLTIAFQFTAIRFAASFMHDFYRLPRTIDPVRLINYRLNRRIKLPSPLNFFSRFEFISLKDGKIELGKDWVTWSAKKLGGPMNMIIYDGNAVYLERGDRFSRVVGPGDQIPFLEWYETIKYVIDLRPRVLEHSFETWTKDGIKVRVTVRILYQIGSPRKNESDLELVYPFDPEAVKKAVERTAVSWSDSEKGPVEYTWNDATWGQVIEIIPGYIGSRMLDDLMIAERQNGQILSPDVIKDLGKKLNQATNQFGVYVTDFQIVQIKVPQKVNEMQTENWKVGWQGANTITDGLAKAFSIRSREKARAEAQKELILAIADGLEKNTSGNFTEPLLFSLSGVLDKSLKNPILRAKLAGETLDTLEKLQKFLRKSPKTEDKL